MRRNVSVENGPLRMHCGLSITCNNRHHTKRMGIRKLCILYCCCREKLPRRPRVWAIGQNMLEKNTKILCTCNAFSQRDNKKAFAFSSPQTNKASAKWGVVESSNAGAELLCGHRASCGVYTRVSMRKRISPNTINSSEERKIRFRSHMTQTVVR